MNEKNKDIFETSSDIAKMEEQIVLADDTSSANAVAAIANVTYSGVYKLKSKSCCLYATVENDNFTSAKVVVDNDKGAREQWFRITNLGGGQHSIRPLHKTNLALTIKRVNSSYEVNAIPCSCDTLATLDAASRWTIDSNGTIRNALYDCEVMAIASSESCNFGPVFAAASSGSANQQWSFTQVSNVPSKLIIYKHPTTAYIGTKVSAGVVEVSSATAVSQSVTWKSSSSSVATISSDGMITPLAVGTTKITATSSANSSLSDSFTLTVSNPVNASVSLNKSSASLYIGQTEQLSATVTPSGGAVQWDSSSSAVATVDSKGLVTAKAAGTAKITATAYGITKSCSVTVKYGSITVNKQNNKDSALVGGTIQLTAATTPSGRTVSWKSSDTSVATVDGNGKVTIKGIGTVQITASSTGLCPQSVTLYGILSDGVYNLKNVGGRMYARMDGTDLFEKHSSLSLNGVYDPSEDVRMMWRLHYHGEGKYSIRSYADPRRGIHVTDYEPSVTDSISDSDTLNARGGAWYISSDSAGYILTNVNLKESSLASVLALPKNYSIHDTKLIYENTAGTTSNQERRWKFECVCSAPAGLYLYKYNYSGSGNLSAVSLFTASSITKDIGEQVKFRAVYRNPDNISQSFTWTSSDKNVTAVEDGIVTAKREGPATITVKHSSGAKSEVTIKVPYYEYEEFTTLLTETPYCQSAINDINLGKSLYNAADETYRDSFYDSIVSIYLVACAAADHYSDTEDMDIAGKYLRYFLDRSGKKIEDFPVKRSLENKESNQYRNFVNEIDRTLIAAEKFLLTRSSVSFVNAEEYSHNDEVAMSGDNWYKSINKYRSMIKCTATSIGNESFNATIQYIIKDYYDWDPTKSSFDMFNIAQSELWNMHFVGISQNFEIEGSATITISWKQGQKIGEVDYDIK